jgi:hypothetical protein
MDSRRHLACNAIVKLNPIYRHGELSRFRFHCILELFAGIGTIRSAFLRHLRNGSGIPTSSDDMVRLAKPIGTPVKKHAAPIAHDGSSVLPHSMLLLIWMLWMVSVLLLLWLLFRMLGARATLMLSYSLFPLMEEFLSVSRSWVALKCEMDRSCDSLSTNWKASLITIL